MVVLKVKNGNKHRDISGIGKTIAKMALVFSFTRMAISMKACGVKTIDTVRELIGEMKQES